MKSKLQKFFRKNHNLSNTNPLASQCECLSNDYKCHTARFGEFFRKLYRYTQQLLFELNDADFALRYDALLEILNPNGYSLFYGQMRPISLLLIVVLILNMVRSGQILSTETPHKIVQQGLHHEKGTVWCGFTANCWKLFRENRERGERYLQMLRDCAIPRLKNKHKWIENVISIDNWQRVFGFSWHFVNLCSARSPDLNPFKN